MVIQIEDNVLVRGSWPPPKHQSVFVQKRGTLHLPLYCLYHQYWSCFSRSCSVRPLLRSSTYGLTDHCSCTNSASCIHIYPLHSLQYVLHIICEIPPMMLMDFAASIIFPCFLSLHQLFGSLLPR